MGLKEANVAGENEEGICFFLSFFETGSPYVVHAVLEFMIFFILPRAVITGMNHHTRLELSLLKNHSIVNI
jgi:hypothetical protein